MVMWGGGLFTPKLVEVSEVFCGHEPSEIWLQNVRAQSKALEPSAPAGGKFLAPLKQET
jgi:hypothetical protein